MVTIVTNHAMGVYLIPVMTMVTVQMELGVTLDGNPDN
jgi:hypothetical protein